MFILKLQCTDSVSANTWADVTNCCCFLYQCYSFSVHSVLFIILKIVLFACLNKELSLWWIFSYLVLLIGGLENELSATIFCRWQVNAYIHTNISKEWKISFCCLGRLNYCKYLNLFCNYTIWFFTVSSQINTSNVQQIICVDTLLGNGTSPSILDRKMKWIEAFQSRLMTTSIGFFLSHWYNLFNNLQYSQFLLTLFS